jgi:hypothetical protein
MPAVGLTCIAAFGKSENNAGGGVLTSRDWFELARAAHGLVHAFLRVLSQEGVEKLARELVNSKRYWGKIARENAARK